jgi:hypothetical protein
MYGAVRLRRLGLDVSALAHGIHAGNCGKTGSANYANLCLIVITADRGHPEYAELPRANCWKGALLYDSLLLEMSYRVVR